MTPRHREVMGLLFDFIAGSTASGGFGGGSGGNGSAAQEDATKARAAAAASVPVNKITAFMEVMKTYADTSTEPGPGALGLASQPSL